MEGIPSYLLAILSGTPVIVVVLCVFDKIKFATSLCIFFLSSSPFLVGLIYQYPHPTIETQVKASSTIPYLVGITLVLMAVVSLTPIMKIGSMSKNSSPSITRWFLLVGGYAFYLIAITGALIYWYVPGIVGANEPSPIGGVIFYNIFFVVSAIIMYFSSRKNSEKRPNLMRKIIISLIVFGIGETALVMSFILIYAFPAEPATSFPNEASYIFISTLILGILLLILNRESVSKTKALSTSSKAIDTNK